ncbi:TonB-dependent receptor domain-containing protein [Chitinophaga barathri]|uniref:TonB-dependent receptor n=1 Tax=Chitinophaga barathri TaxID=1647451 RepID=A0A3N4MCB9_9BACT|nr:TonB-dependent receptor [Chitinophaga barathri]RPD41484.1 TonB-dependent receptor [Chitinophaga barathri]
MQKMISCACCRKKAPGLRLFYRLLSVILFFCLQAPAQDAGQPKVDLDADNQPLENIFRLLEKQTGLSFAYNNREIKNRLEEKFSFKETATPLSVILQQISKRTGLQFKQAGRIISVQPLPASPPGKAAGKVAGTIIDQQTGEPIPGATVRIADKGTVTGADGRFSIGLPDGKYSAIVSYIGYGNKEITGIDIKGGETFTANITLKKAKGTLAGITVRATVRQEGATALYARQRNSQSFTDGISADLVQQTPDNNVAQVLKRIAGVTVQDNKFVVIRGMGERYNNIQLNGSSLPSTEPNRRNFNFDIIPSNLVDNIVVSKTFTPDMQGEFAGGTVQVSTLSIPAERMLNIGIGSGFNTQSTGKDLYSNSRYSGDYFFGTDARNFLTNGWTEKFAGAYGNLEERNRMAAQLPNHWGLKRYTGQPVQNYSLSTGLPVKLKGDNTFGVVAAATYRHEETREDYYWKAPNSTATASDGIRSTFVTSVAGIVNAGWKNKHHRISWNNLYNYRFTHENGYQTDEDPADTPPVILKTLSSVRQNTLWQTRLSGEHTLFAGKLKADWFGDFNKLERNQPDDRYNRGTIKGETVHGERAIEWWAAYPNQSVPFDAGGIFASLLTEKKWNAGANFLLPFVVAGNKQSFKTGYWGTFRTADYKQSSFNIFEPVPGDKSMRPIAEVFAPENFASGKYILQAFTHGPSGGDLVNGDSYGGTQDIHAGYIMGDFSFFKKLHIIGGVRFESEKVSVNTIARPVDTKWIDTVMEYKTDAFLPSVTAAYDILPMLKARAAYSRTLARPDFRERTLSVYYDLWERATVIGSDHLRTSFSDNYDLRLEWYPGAGEIISFSAFKKDLKDPIEMLAHPTNSGDRITYVRLLEAHAKGLELNLRKSFGFAAEKLSNLFLTANVTHMTGATQLESIKEGNEFISISDKRKRLPIGLSPWAYNAGLAYNAGIIGASVNYNYTGYRIRYAGSTEYNDQFEAARGTLDVQLSCRFLKNRMELRVNASDLLAAPFIFYQNDYTVVEDAAGNKTYTYKDGGDNSYNIEHDAVLRKGRKGSSFSFTLNYSF